MIAGLQDTLVSQPVLKGCKIKDQPLHYLPFPPYAREVFGIDGLMLIVLLVK